MSCNNDECKRLQGLDEYELNLETCTASRRALSNAHKYYANMLMALDSRSASAGERAYQAQMHQIATASIATMIYASEQAMAKAVEKHFATYALAIVGGRGFTDKAAFADIMTSFIAKRKGVMPSRVVSGGAKGVDSLARDWAIDNNVPVTEFTPDWNKYGRSAGIMRNADIVKAADVVLALPTPSSRGTHDSIKRAQKLNKELVVVEVPDC